jgi:nucleoside-diphosphate-sugar epimerase
MAKYFVTGATGFIGGEIVKQLIGRGHKVAALVRSPERAGILKALGVEIHPGDITDRETLITPMTGVDGVFHVAAWYKVGVKEPLAEQINVEGTRNVLHTMRALQIPRGVYTSSVAVFSDTKGAVPDERYRYGGAHLSEYDRTKWMAHYRVALPEMEAGLPLSIVMPGVVYGPGDTSGMHTALVDLLRGRLPMTPARTAFCWSHVEDTARGHILAMEKGGPGETYIITGPRHTFEYAFDLAASIAKVRAPLFHPRPHMMRAMAAATTVIGRFITMPPALTPEALRVIAGTTYFGSNEKAVRELGFAPRPLEEGMAQTIEHAQRLVARKA